MLSGKAAYVWVNVFLQSKRSFSLGMQVLPPFVELVVFNVIRSV